MLLDLLPLFSGLQELSDQAGSEFENADVRWVITVPAIWKQPAKQFMRQAAYQVRAGLGRGPGRRNRVPGVVAPSGIVQHSQLLRQQWGGSRGKGLGHGDREPSCSSASSWERRRDQSNSDRTWDPVSFRLHTFLGCVSTVDSLGLGFPRHFSMSE